MTFMNKEYFNKSLSLFIIAVSFLYIFSIIRFRPLVGDDVLFLFEGGYTPYLSDTLELGEYITSIFQGMQTLRELYLNFGFGIGMIYFWLFAPMIGLTVNAIIVCLVYLAIVAITLHILYGRELLQHPSIIALIVMMFFFYNPSMDYYMMRIMAFAYGVPCMLYLLFGDLIYNSCGKIQIGKRRLLIINVVGFLAGLSHILLGVWFIVWIWFLLKELGIKIAHSQKCFLGWGIGYFILVLTPGFYNRITLPHDASIHEPLLPRLLASIDVHMRCFYLCEVLGKIILSVIVTFVCICVFKKFTQKTYTSLFYLFELLNLTIVSIILWGSVSNTPNYGIMGLYIVTIMICIKLIQYSEEKIKKLLSSICLIVFFCSLVDIYSWVPNMVRQSIQRTEIIHEAVLNNESEIHVPAFSYEVRRRRVMFIGETDTTKALAAEWYQKYYGIRVIVDE